MTVIAVLDGAGAVIEVFTSPFTATDYGGLPTYVDTPDSYGFEAYLRCTWDFDNSRFLAAPPGPPFSELGMRRAVHNMLDSISYSWGYAYPREGSRFELMSYAGYDTAPTRRRAEAELFRDWRDACMTAFDALVAASLREVDPVPLPPNDVDLFTIMPTVPVRPVPEPD